MATRDADKPKKRPLFSDVKMKTQVVLLPNEVR